MSTTTITRTLISRLPRWMRSPRFTDEEQTRTARLLHLTGLLLLGGALVHGWFNIGGNNRLMVAFYAQSTVVLWALILNRRGRQSSASVLLISSLTAVIGAVICFGHEGIRDVAVLALPSNLIVAGVLLSRRQFVILSIGSLVFVAVMGFVHVQGWLPIPKAIETGSSTVIDAVIILGGAVLVIGYLANFLRQRLNAARANAAALVLQTERLRASREKLHSLLDMAADAFFLADPAGRIVDVNRLAVEFTGLQKTELVGRPLEELLPATASARSAASGTETSGIPGKLLRKDGKSLSVEVSSRVMPDAHVQAFVRDVSRRHELEAQLRQSQKMEAVGSLAGGIAHDFNNLLTVLQGHIDLVNGDPSLTPMVRESLTVMGDVAHRASELTKQLLAFSRRQVLQISTLDFSTLVDELTRLLRRTLGENIQLVWQSQPERFWVEGDSGMLLQVLMNLAVNARDAMPGGGRLQLELDECQVLPKPTANENGEALAKRFVRITVSDTGCGIPPELLPRIGEPFFTTKEVGRGTGLGLAMAFGIIQQHHGWIEVASQPGNGTTFTIFLPATTAPVVEVKPKAAPISSPRAGGAETILLVEDEPAVRSLMARVLKHQGFEVLTASNGPAALELWREHHSRVRLLICDMIMPEGLSGSDVARQCRAKNPRLPIVLCTGYTSESLTDDLRNENGFSYLAKPFKPGELIELVREHLDDPAAENRTRA